MKILFDLKVIEAYSQNIILDNNTHIFLHVLKNLYPNNENIQVIHLVHITI